MNKPAKEDTVASEMVATALVFSFIELLRELRQSDPEFARKYVSRIRAYTKKDDEFWRERKKTVRFMQLIANEVDETERPKNGG